MKAASKSSKRERQKHRLRAFHEAGHAVAARLLGIEIAEARMKDDDAQVLTHSAAYAADPSDAPAHLAALYADLQVALAGDIGQQLGGYPPYDYGVEDADAAIIGNCAGML